MKERKNKKAGGAAAAAVLILGLLGNLAEGGEAVVLLPILMLAILGVVLGLVFGKKYKKIVPVFVPKKKETCEFGKANHEFSHNADRRMAQLDNFYENGIIDRAEYEFLKERWSKN